jgi:hypothetical protein
VNLGIGQPAVVSTGAIQRAVTSAANDDPFGRPLISTGLYLGGATSAAAGFSFVLLGLLDGSNRHLIGGGALLAGGVGAALLGYGIERLDR